MNDLEGTLWSDYNQVKDFTQVANNEDKLRLMEYQDRIRRELLDHKKMEQESIMEKSRNRVNLVKWGATTVIGVVMAIIAMRFEETSTLTGDTRRGAVRSMVDKLFRM